MRVLLLNQTFYPDAVSTAQHLKDFALGLRAAGHEVAVIAARRAYDDPNKIFPARECWQGIEVYRVRSTAFGKRAKWRRAADFGSFLWSCVWRLLTVPRPDVVVALTSPPLISSLGALYAHLTCARFVYWVMDLNPDEAVAAGWLRPRSIATQILEALSRFSLRRAQRVVALDHFMADRIAAKGIAPPKIAIIPPWAHDDLVRFDGPGRKHFRQQHGIESKFVVMYSGNHSPCHPLTTLLEAIRKLGGDGRLSFVFVGGGSELPKIEAFAAQHQLKNLRTLPYQPLEVLSGSLSAADLHVVIMGDPFVGTIHPCKIYNILSVGAPVLYIGPAESHISEIFELLKRAGTCYSARHGDVAGLVAQLQAAVLKGGRGDPEIYADVSRRFSKGVLLAKQISCTIEDSSEKR